MEEELLGDVVRECQEADSTSRVESLARRRTRLRISSDSAIEGILLDPEVNGTIGYRNEEFPSVGRTKIF